jgi:hypothetical protein
MVKQQNKRNMKTQEAFLPISRSFLKRNQTLLNLTRAGVRDNGTFPILTLRQRKGFFSSRPSMSMASLPPN